MHLDHLSKGSPKSISNPEQVLPVAKLPLEAHALGDLKARDDAPLDFACRTSRLFRRPADTPSWTDKGRVYGSVLMGNHYQDSAAGRRGFFGTPGAEGAREIRSLLRSEDSRGYFGSQRFRERLLALLPKTDADIRTDQGQHYEAAVLMKDSAEDMAERIFIREPRAAGLNERH